MAGTKAWIWSRPIVESPTRPSARNQSFGLSRLRVPWSSPRLDRAHPLPLSAMFSGVELSVEPSQLARIKCLPSRTFRPLRFLVKSAETKCAIFYNLRSPIILTILPNNRLISSAQPFLSPLLNHNVGRY